ncbi:DUF6640 family protein [Nocardia donostiensis]|uniref:Uncharacterized protein n=1 Tax=Nocardia donostiensis TaxID=1538463 RepID=A0A1W0ARM3_9NOCA|nr:DUF6640 family protein [Nocardia donostiensis]ONM49603.1 hypothetical protein B0T46_07120 [Nocardia donostiensis]OQS12895.1 hypothetical protein B0T36_22645 [Nocardia donostiensis]OQS19224.1 hypothetical protein B0T44_15410 [Nocardia donostiensis]
MTTSARHWTIPRILVQLVLLVTMFVPLLADLVIPDIAAMHLHNPAWPPHAKFHDAQYLVMSALLGLTGSVILRRRAGDLRAQFRWAAALAAITWVGMFGALLFPGTAAQDPEHRAGNPPILGLDPQLFVALIVLVTVAIAVVVEQVAQVCSGDQWTTKSSRAM